MIKFSTKKYWGIEGFGQVFKRLWKILSDFQEIEEIFGDLLEFQKLDEIFDKMTLHQSRSQKNWKIGGSGQIFKKLRRLRCSPQLMWSPDDIFLVILGIEGFSDLQILFSLFLILRPSFELSLFF